jgi:hypothetical protein
MLMRLEAPPSESRGAVRNRGSGDRRSGQDGGEGVAVGPFLISCHALSL